MKDHSKIAAIAAPAADNVVHDMYLMQVETPAGSKRPWDCYKLVQTIPGAQAYMTKAESKCALWK